MRALIATLVAFISIASASSHAEACTTFLLTAGDGLRVGKSYDWHTPDGMVIWNPSGLKKQALLLARGDKAARWESTHASLTFNQYGREMPNGGMNDAGLVVEIMWLESSEYPAADPRPVVGELQWIQYMLDRAATTADAVRLAAQIRVRPTYAKVHYLACDRQGDCAAFEYIDGRLEVRHGDDLQVSTLTNDTYDESLARLHRHTGFGGSTPLPLGLGSMERFVRVSARVKGYRDHPPADLTKATFAVLDSVHMTDYTRWQIVYDPRGMQVWFRTGRAGTVKRIQISELSRGCTQPALAMDIDSPRAGDATERLRLWTREANLGLLQRTLKPMLAKGALPRRAPQMLTAYGGGSSCEPSQMLCAGKDGKPRPCGGP